MKHIINSLEHSSLPVEKITTLHADVEDIAKLAVVPWKGDISKFQSLNEKRIFEMLINTPITCVKIRLKYYVIGGFRSWSIIMNFFQNRKETHVPIQLVGCRMNTQKRREFAAASLLLPLLTYSLGQHGYQSIGRAWESIQMFNMDLFNAFFAHGASSKSRLSRELGYSYESFYKGDKSNAQ